MKTISNDFKNQIKLLGREIDFKFFLHTNDKILTEDSKFLITQDNKHLVVEQFNEEEIDEIITSENIYNVAVIRNAKLLSTVMQGLEFEVAYDLRIGDTIDASFGLKINNDYEWINFGRYMVYEKEFNEDTKTYSYVAYDSMLLSMITLDDRSLIENVTIKTAIENIASKVGLSVNITQEDETALPNLTKVIATDTFKDLEMTYRDVLDMICQALGINMLSNSKVLVLKTINRTPVDTINEEYLKDTNVRFGKKYGPINSIVLSRSEDNDNIYKKNQTSIDLYGLTEFKIKDNLIMLGNDREEYIDEIYNQLHNLEYYINDFKSTGITYLELFDMYNVTIGDKTYPCLLLNDEIKIKQGLEESIYTEEPEETTTDYKTSSKTDKEVSFIVDKQKGKINAKVSKGEVINEINLDESGVSINAEKINLNGVVTANNNFKILNDGSMEAKNGKFEGKVEADEGEIAEWIIDKNKGLYNGTGNGQAGIGINGKSHAFWAGGTDPGTAPFHVGHGGDVHASNMNITGGSIILQTDEINDKIFVGGTSSTTGETIESRMGWGNFYLYRGGTSKVALYTGSTTEVGGQIRLYDGSHNTKVSANGATGNITCVSLTQTSLEKSKKNFEKYENALKEIQNIDIYKYNYKDEKDEDKKHIGFVIGEKYKYSKDITSIDNEGNEIGADLYSFISVCCKAIQEQQEQIEELKKEIKSLKEGDK